jgi:hypothetical protein
VVHLLYLIGCLYILLLVCTTKASIGRIAASELHSSWASITTLLIGGVSSAGSRRIHIACQASCHLPREVPPPHSSTSPMINGCFTSLMYSVHYYSLCLPPQTHIELASLYIDSIAPTLSVHTLRAARLGFLIGHTPKPFLFRRTHSSL